MRQQMMGFWDGSGISWTIGKESAPRSRQITTPTPHQSAPAICHPYDRHMAS